MARRVLFLAAVVLLALPTPALAQDSLQQVKDLYASAAYEDALAVLGRLSDREPAPELAQYRISCLVALGRSAEAQKSIEAVVTSHPAYLPDPAETPPRVRELFVATRRQMLPTVARRMYLDAKAAFDRKSESATAKFKALVDLIDQTKPADEALAELRVLAAGFLDLSKAISSAKAAAEAAAAPEASAASASPPPAARPPEITRPVVVAQDFPRWVPFDTVSRQTEFVGSVKVRIRATGDVESAEILKPVHPAYDTALLTAARNWRYKPATQNGIAVPAEHIVEVRLRPRE